MKFRILHRSPDLYTKSQFEQKNLPFRSTDTRLCPLAPAIEHQRALVAAKIDRIFAKPFVHQFEGHTDSVKSLARCNHSTFDFFTGGCEGDIRFWSAAQKKCWKHIRGAHDGVIEGLTVAGDDKYLFSCSRDRKIKQWAVQKYYGVLNQDSSIIDDIWSDREAQDTYMSDSVESPVQTFLAGSALTSVDHRLELGHLVATGEKVWLWDQNRTTPLGEFEWGNDTYYSAKWSPSETHLVLLTSSDNSVLLYDTRQQEGAQKVVLEMRSNASCWNPQKPFNFTVANEDSNLYTFDMRKISKVLKIHNGFVNAALDVDYSPTGRHIVGGSFDQTIRVWEEHESRSSSTYHTRRMQLVLTTKFNGDGRYIYSGSSDLNVRVWKTNPSEALGVLNPSQQRKIQEREALKQKYRHMPQVERILKHQHVPKYIKGQTKKRLVMSHAESRKEKNRRAHNPALAEMKSLKESMIRQIHCDPPQQHPPDHEKADEGGEGDGK